MNKVDIVKSEFKPIRTQTQIITQLYCFFFVYRCFINMFTRSNLEITLILRTYELGWVNFNS